VTDVSASDFCDDAPFDPGLRHVELWAAARNALSFMISLFESPAAVACLRMMGKKLRADILAWLRPIEHLLRRLIALEARGVKAVFARTRRGAKRARRAVALDLENSAAWPVSFKLGVRGLKRFATRTRTAPLQNLRPALPNWPKPERVKGVYDSFAVARRFEAVLRVMRAPMGYIRRCARRLAREPDLIGKLAEAPKLGDNVLCRWALGEVQTGLLADTS
jgi:hypothetical protein